MKKKIPAQVYLKGKIPKFLLITAFTVFLLLLPYPNKYFFTPKITGSIGKSSSILLPEPPPYPLNEMNIPPPFLTAQAIYILDLPSDVVLYEKNSEVRLPPASTTKIATALTAMDIFDFEDILKVKEVLKEGRTMGLVNGEEITFEALLYGALVHSANDAAYAIAQNYSEGTDKFVEKMNEKALKLNLLNTRFSNPAGLDDNNQFTTASDLAKLAKVAIGDKRFAKIVSTRSITVSDVNYTIFHDLKNVNELLGKIPGVAGVKTGFTQNGGEILISEVKKNNRNILIVILKSSDRFGETEKLINWVFSNFSWKNVEEINQAIRGE